MWALGKRRGGGNVYHREAIKGSAHCDYRVELNMDTATDTIPKEGWKCRRCTAIEPKN